MGCWKQRRRHTAKKSPARHRGLCAVLTARTTRATRKSTVSDSTHWQWETKTGNIDLHVFPCVILFLCFSVLLVLRLPRLGKRELILNLSVSSSSWGLGRAAVCDCGTPWTFLLPFCSPWKITDRWPSWYYGRKRSREALCPLRSKTWGGDDEDAVVCSAQALCGGGINVPSYHGRKLAWAYCGPWGRPVCRART